MQATQTKWMSEAGPRQTKAVNDALGKLRWRGKAIVEIRDYGRAEVVPICGNVSEACQKALDEIGEEYGYLVTSDNYRAIVEDLEDATRNLVVPEVDCRSTEQERKEREEFARKQREEMAESSRKSVESCAAIMAKKPAWAEAAIVAELDEDDSDMMTDYHNHKTTRRVVIGWRKGKREDFRQLRAAAAQFEPTKHLGPGCDTWYLVGEWDGCQKYLSGSGYPAMGNRAEFSTEAEALNAAAIIFEKTGVKVDVRFDSCEHRENYSMGSGNYLKRGSDDSSGWRVVSERLPLNGYIYEDGLPVEKAPEVSKSGAGYEIQKHYHTKRQIDIWAVVLLSRVDRAEFERLRDSAQDGGGWYSPKWSSFPGGFCFTSEEKAREWAGRMFDGGSGAELSPSDPPQAPTETRPVTTVATVLRDAADKLQDKIDERTRPMTQNYTPKRGREYNSRCHEGENLRRCQKAMRALADLHEQGTCPDNLKSLRTKAQILPLVSTSGDSQGYYDYRDSGKYRDNSEQGKALQSLIDETADEKRKRELTYKLQELQRSNIEGFFPTPRTVALRMVELADILPGHVILEPSAGAGHLADVIVEECGQLVSVNCCERMHTLRQILEMKGHSLLNATDCLEIRPQDASYNRILMNPPYERGQDAKHVRHCYDLLAEGGRLVAIVSSGVLFRQSAAGFREWLDEVGAVIEPLPEGSFDTQEAFRRTGVSASLVIIDKE